MRLLKRSFSKACLCPDFNLNSSVDSYLFCVRDGHLSLKYLYIEIY